MFRQMMMSDDLLFSQKVPKKRKQQIGLNNSNSKISRVTPSAWHKIKTQVVNSSPPFINGLCAYQVDSLCGTKDERYWEKEYTTKWASYSSVRYRNCKGSFICQNPLCHYYIEYKEQNKVNFDKNGLCTICSAEGTLNPCMARKYVTKNDSGYIVYHIGNLGCTCKLKFKRPTNLVSQAISQNPMTKPTKIQSNAIIAALRKKEPWNTVLDRVSAVIDEKAISNEKIKQNKKAYNFGASFDGVVQAKSYFDEKDKYLISNVDESTGTVFKTSNEKMKMATMITF